ncbi:hypothetical protein PG989_002235 [Apiospora arundinis]
MAPSKPTRGRPAGREPRAAASGTPKKTEPITAAESGEPVVKRGRGRPPKNGVSKVVKPPPSGRPRGRPPMDPSLKKPAPPPKEPSGRGRGRPPKAGGAATPKKPTPKKLITSTKKAGIASANNARLARASRRKSNDVAEDVPVSGEEDEQEDDEEEPVAAGDDDEDDEHADSDVDLGIEADMNAGVPLDDDENEDDDAPGYVAGDIDVEV